MGNNICGPSKGDLSGRMEDKKGEGYKMYDGPINSNLSMRSFITQALPRFSQLENS
jgi:hypothetical protein